MQIHYNTIQSADDYIRVYGPYLVGTLGGWMLMGATMVLLLMTLASRNIKWIWLTLLLYTVSVQFNNSSQTQGDLLFPFNSIRSLSRPLTLLFLILLIVPALQ